MQEYQPQNKKQAEKIGMDWKKKRRQQ